MEPKEKTFRAWVYLVLWGALILLGVIEKRLFGHPDWMVFFHLPAAVFLVLGMHDLTKRIRWRYKLELDRRNL